MGWCKMSMSGLQENKLTVIICLLIVFCQIRRIGCDIYCPSGCQCSRAATEAVVQCNSRLNHSETSKVFNSLDQVKLIYFSQNGIEQLNISACNMSYSSYLTLSKNNISSLDDNNLIFCASKVYSLSLAENQITTIDKNYFSKFSHLRVIDLSWNHIAFIDPQTFVTGDISYLKLNHNRLKELDMWIFQMPRLRWPNLIVYINLSHNKIGKMVNTVGYKVSSFVSDARIVLDLTYNQLTSVYNILQAINVEVANDMLNLLKSNLLMKYNPYHCDCNMYQVIKLFLPYLDFFRNSDNYSMDLIQLKCAEPERLKGNIIIDLPLDQFQCEVEKCDDIGKCKCSHTPANDTLTVNCENRQLHEFPTFSNHTYSNYDLYLANNSISELKEEVYLKNVTRIDLAFNKVRLWSKDTLNSLNKLKVLHLHNNNLEKLPEGIDTWENSLSQVTLRNNPFICDCDHQRFKIWTTKATITDLNEVKCQKPSKIKGKPISDVAFTVFECHRSYTLALSLGLGLPLILISALLLTVFVLRDYMKVFLFHHFGWRYKYDYSDTSKEYDVFISYSNQDEDMLHEIYEKLEEWSIPYNVCLHYRDFIPGESIAENIIRCIQSSKCTVMMISNNFIQSQWCKYEFKTAHYEAIEEKNCKVILVLLEDIDEKEMDTDLKLYIKTHTYLKLSENHFLTKLMMGLPKPSGVRNPIGL